MELTHTNDIGIIQSLHNDVLSKVKLIIHNQFPGIELVSPLYYSNGAVCCLSPDQRVDVGSTMQAGFNIDLAQEEPIGALMYKLQRKNTDQPDEKAISNEEAICTRLVMIWKVYRSGEFHIVSFLIEHDKDCIWDKDKLIKLVKRRKLFNIQYTSFEDTWLMHDNTVLMTSLNVTRKEKHYKLEMTISETNINEDTRRSLYISLNK
jgi:hypothetical protein